MRQDDLSERHRQTPLLESVQTLWKLSDLEFARVCGVSQQTLREWRRNGVPTDRSAAIADLAAATDMLARFVEQERIPAIVRSPVPLLSEYSLLDTACQGRYAEVRGMVAAMFDLRRVQP